MATVSIKGIVVGVVVSLLLDVAGSIGLTAALGGIPLLELPPEEQRVALENFTRATPFLLGSMVVGLLTTVLGGYIAARIARRAAYLNSALVGVVGVVLGLALSQGLPLWFNALALLLAVPLALLGGHIVANGNRNG